MAFNILNIGFDGTVASTFAERTNYVSDGDNNDIFYFLGTNFGTSIWSNPLAGSYVSFIGNEGAGTLTNGVTLTDNNTSTGVTHDTDSNVVFSAVFNFNNVAIQPSGIQLRNQSAGSTPMTSINIQVSNDNLTYKTVSNLSNVSSHQWGSFENNFNPNFEIGFYKYIRIDYLITNGSSWGGLREVKLYGSLKRTDGGEASRVSLPSTIEQLPDVDIDSPNDGDYLYWAQGIVKHQREKLYETVRTTNNLVLEDEQFLPNFYIVTPSSTRTVDLPTNPKAGQFFRIRNLNNNFEIQIREPVAVVVATIGGAGGPGLTQADCYYDGTEWIIITF